MARTLIIVAALLACAACAEPAGSYGLARGDANYDAMKMATDACKARGGGLVLKKGGDATELSDYQCIIGKGS